MSHLLTLVGVVLVFLAFGFLAVGANLFEALGCAGAGAALCTGALAYDTNWARE